jgi:DNA-binding CsgD family transcriptional regulator
MNDLIWDKGMIAEFSNLACLTDEEMIVLNDWAYGKSIVFTAMQHNMSDSKVSDIRGRLRKKYDLVQPRSNILPPRVKRK